jgi:ABC-type transport system involved in cytochrome c biogenesis permease subunit
MSMPWRRPRSLARLAVALSLAVAFLRLAAASAADLPRSLDLAPLRRLVVQHDGRIMPLDTLARDVVWKVLGRKAYTDNDPVLLLLAWTFDAASWQRKPVVAIGNERLRAELQLPRGQTLFSYHDLVSHERFLSVLDQAEGLPPGRKRDALQQKVGRLSDQLVALQQVFNGHTIRLIPQGDSPQAAWMTVAALLDSDEAQLQAARDAWLALGAAFHAEDAGAFAQASASLAMTLEQLPAAFRPTPAAIDRELRYHRLGLYRKAWLTLALATVLAAAALALRLRWLDWLTAAVTLAGTGVFTYALSLRWAVAGRIPAANMFESLLFLSWGAAAFAVVAFFTFRHRSVPLTAAAIGALALCLADTLPMDSFIRPVAPVLLDTFWMSLHVPVIMISYAVLAIAVLIAHVQVVAAALLPEDRPLVARLDRFLYGYILAGSLLLLVGIVTGSMWAASSWGRYWGWDPKEVWSLVALLGYLAIVHVRLPQSRRTPAGLFVGALLALGVFGVVSLRLVPFGLGKVVALAAVALAAAYFLLADSRFATAAKSIIAFWLIIMTYVGVNYVLGTGLHSYGFGVGAVASRMLVIGALDLAVLVLFGAIHRLRHRCRRLSAECPSAAPGP